MTPATQVEFGMREIFSSSYQTYTVSAQFQQRIERIHYLYISKIDNANNVVTLETLDPKKSYSLEDWRSIGKAFKVVTMTSIQDKILLSLPESYQANFPGEEGKYVLNTGDKKNGVILVDYIQYLNKHDYVVTLKQYVEFLRMVVTKNQQVPPSK